MFMFQIIKDDDLEELRELSSIDYKMVCHGKWRGSDVAIKRTNQQERGSSDRLVQFSYFRFLCTCLYLSFYR